MNLKYNWTKEDLKKELTDKRMKTNTIFLILGILLYIYLMYGGIKSGVFDNKIILLYGLIYTCVLAIVLFVSAKIYVYLSLKKNDKDTNKAYGMYEIVLDDNSINVSINNEKVSYNYKDITKLKEKRNSFFIRTKKDKIGLIFKQKVIGKEDYNKLLSYIKQALK